MLKKEAQKYLLQVEKIAEQFGYDVHYEKDHPTSSPRNRVLGLLNLVQRDQRFLKKLYRLYTGWGGNWSWHIRTEILVRINDLPYIKKLIAKKALDDNGAESPESRFILERDKELYDSDPEFIDNLAQNAVDGFIQTAAVGATRNLSILKKFSRLNDTNQYKYVRPSRAASEAFRNKCLKEAALNRLQILHPKV
ncbi:MAG: hypothetical protein WC473_01090 [Patescibacteria group bacterium]|jgi:hypothetical protein